jgi:hypothetical protein
VTGRTVCVVRADGPRVTDGQFEKESRPSSSAPRITDSLRPILGRSASNRCCADGLQCLGRRSAKLHPTENSWPNGSKRRRSRTRDEHEEHLDELHLADGPPATRGRSARHRNSSPSLKSKSPNHLSIHGSPKRLKLLRKDLGKV